MPHDLEQFGHRQELSRSLSCTFGGREPVRRVAPGTILDLCTEDCSGDRVRDVGDLPSVVCEFPYLNPVTGPIHVEGAEPGDTLARRAVRPRRRALPPGRRRGVRHIHDRLREAARLYLMESRTGTGGTAPAR